MWICLVIPLIIVLDFFYGLVNMVNDFGPVLGCVSIKPGHIGFVLQVVLNKDRAKFSFVEMN